jgi:hypothetical protein
MTPADGPSEAVKGGVHMLAFGLCCVLLAHNTAMLITRPNRENGINAVVYAAGCAFEWHRALRHFTRAAD